MTGVDAVARARAVLDGLHLQATEQGPESDPATARRRAARLWDAARRPGAGMTAVPWDALPEVLQGHVADVVARAVVDVLEAEQLMYRALVDVLADYEVTRVAADAALAAGDRLTPQDRLDETSRREWALSRARRMEKNLEGRA